jgi:hypothetical protein
MTQDPNTRDYAKEYQRDHASPAAKKARNARNPARRRMTKELGEQAVRGKDVDHKQPLSKGGSNARSNLRVLPVKANRGRNN